MLEYIIIFLLTVIVFGYFYVKRSYSYWSRAGVPYIEPEFPFGNFKTMLRMEHSSAMFLKFYNQSKGKGPFTGLYSFFSPNIIVTDLDLVKSILVKDFNYFVDRGGYYNEKDDPMSASLFFIEGDHWRHVRHKVTPTFTSGKMKYMFPTVCTVASEYIKCVERHMGNSSEIEMKDILARYTTDVIGTCVFGIDCNSLTNPESLFREYGRRAFAEPHNTGLWYSFVITAPYLARKLGILAYNKEISDFFMNVVRETIDYREKNVTNRKDFMQLFIQLLNRKNTNESKSEELGLTMNEVAAHAFLLFMAGFETTSSTLSYALLELASNQDIQQKLREDVQDTLENHKGEFTYEAMMEMKYMDKVINETLRKYPTLSLLARKTTADYKEKTTGVIIKKGISVFIPAYAIQHDPEYYPNPEQFNPENFNDEAVQSRNPYAFLAFGEGPRNCIGLRFALMKAKIGLATTVNNFKFTLSEKTHMPAEFMTDTLVLNLKGGLYLKMKKI